MIPIETVRKNILNIKNKLLGVFVENNSQFSILSNIELVPAYNMLLPRAILYRGL
jgi:hypothetical protein